MCQLALHQLLTHWHTTLCIEYVLIFARFSIFLPSWAYLGGRGTRHTVRHQGYRSENASGGRTEIQEDKERHTRRQHCQYVCGAKIALYNVWFSALADVERGFCNFCQNPLTSPFFDFFERQEIKSSISNFSESLFVPIWHNLITT